MSFRAILSLFTNNKDKYKSQGTNLIPEDKKILVLQRLFEALNIQKFCNENIIYYIWRTPNEKIDQQYLKDKKKDLTDELARWESYLTQVR
jgi:hypothetical protein